MKGSATQSRLMPATHSTQKMGIRWRPFCAWARALGWSFRAAAQAWMREAQPFNHMHALLLEPREAQPVAVGPKSSVEATLCPRGGP